MANQDTEIEVANSGGDTGFSMQKLVIVIVLVQLVMFGGLAALLSFSGFLGGGQGQMAGDEASSSGVDQSEPIYIPFEKFTVNFGGSRASHFMQVEIQAMTHDPKVKEDVLKHMPVIRNEIILILSSQTLDSVTTFEGKDNLRHSILLAIQEILQKKTNKTGVEEIFFTSFVMQ